MSTRSTKNGLSRRDFARLLTVAGTASLFGGADVALAKPSQLPPTPASPNESYWRSVREQFVMPRGVSIMNAANLCPSSLPVLETLHDLTRDVDGDPSFQNRGKFGVNKERTRTLLAEFLGATPEEVVITRNTSEANNIVSSGIELKAGDEVLIFADNHPSNNAAWKEKGERFGFTVKEIPIVNPFPGAQHYVDAVERAITPRAKLVSVTHLTNTIGDLFPVKEICAAARARDVLSLVDGAQSFGLIAFDLSDMQPDFYTGSAHKWPCGPKETGVLYVNQRSHSKIWASIISVGGGRVGISQKLERFGQRDDPATGAFGTALKFQMDIGRDVIERRSRELATALMEGLSRIDGVHIRTSRKPEENAAVVVFKPGNLDTRKLFAALYENHKIGCAPRGGDRDGLRISPHFYNLHEEIDRTVAAIKQYMATGV